MSSLEGMIVEVVPSFSLLNHAANSLHHFNLLFPLLFFLHTILQPATASTRPWSSYWCIQAWKDERHHGRAGRKSRTSNSH